MGSSNSRMIRPGNRPFLDRSDSDLSVSISAYQQSPSSPPLPPPPPPPGAITPAYASQQKTAEWLQPKASSVQSSSDEEHCVNMDQLMELLKKMNLAKHELKACQTFVEDHAEISKAFQVGLQLISIIQSHYDTDDLSQLELPLQRLSDTYLQLTAEQREALSIFLSMVPFCKVSFELYKRLVQSIEEIMFTSDDYLNCTIFEVRSFWWNLSDSSLAFATQLFAVGIVQEMFQDLKKLSSKDQKFLRNSFTFESAIGVLHNTVKVENLRQSFRDMKLVECLVKFLNFPDLRKLTLVVLLTLSYIIDEDQTHLLMSHESVFELIVSLSKLAWKLPDRRADGFSLQELIGGMINLSRNDEVKVVLVKKGVLPLLKSILEKGNGPERRGAAKLLWELSFHRDNKLMLKEDEELMEKVQELSKNADRKLSKACQGVLWVTKMDEQKVPEILKKKKKKKTEGQGHIMISYQWADQKKLMEVRDTLRRKGYKVWMDIDDLKGSTLQAMAEAVENSAVVLICMSEKYKESVNCRSEAEYAFNLKKPIIPLLMQYNYRADGWLGILVGAKLYFDLSGKYPFADKVEEMIKELGDRGKLDQAIQFDEVEGPLVSETVAPVGKPPHQSATLDVKEWLAENNLERFSSLQNLSSDHVTFLRKLSSRAPEFYYQYVVKIMKGRITVEALTDLMQLTTAIEKS